METALYGQMLILNRNIINTIKAMKKYIFVPALLMAFVMFSCKERAYIDGPGDNSHNLDSIPVTIPDTSGIEISVDSAVAICNALADGAKTGERYKISGVVTANSTSPILVPNPYNNINFIIKDESGTKELTCYYTNNVNNRPFRRSNDVPRVGSKLTVLGTLTKYVNSSGRVTPELTDGFIVRIDKMVAPGPFPGCPEPAEDEISVSQAVEIAMSLANRTPSSTTYNIMGVVTEILEFNKANGNATYIISDGKKYFEVYRGKGINNANFTDASQILPNDTITVKAKVQNYNSLPETSGEAPLLKTTNQN